MSKVIFRSPVPFLLYWSDMISLNSNIQESNLPRVESMSFRSPSRETRSPTETLIVKCIPSGQFRRLIHVSDSHPTSALLLYPLPSPLSRQCPLFPCLSLPLSKASLMGCSDMYDVASGKLIQGGYGSSIDDG